MPISINSLFAAAGLEASGNIPWGTRIPDDRPGVYAVSWSIDPALSHVDAPLYAPSRTAFDALVDSHPDLAVDGSTATFALFSERLSSFWLPDEPVLYIGKAGTSMGHRAGQYYSTRLGARSPHAGGWWLKMIDGFEAAFVHFAASHDPDAAEQAMLRAFRASVDPLAAEDLYDPERIAPFANVDVAKRLFKRHGLTNYKDRRTPPTALTVPSANLPALPQEEIASPTDGIANTVYSQNVTDKDRTRSNLRIPAAFKHVFPTAQSIVRVEINGTVRDVPWRPNGSRSGTLGLGAETMRNLRVRNERITIEVLSDRYVLRPR